MCIALVRVPVERYRVTIDRWSTPGGYRCTLARTGVCRAQARPENAWRGHGLEAWLLPHVEGPQTFRLARHVTSFACRRDDGRPCGGTAPDCPYLRLDPGDKQDLTRLKKLQAIGGTWTCSEWFRILDWYEARSDAAHGRGGDVSHSEASSTEYLISHYLLDPILDWLAFHPDDPAGDLDRELCLVVDEAGWQEVVSAIDEPTPPTTPPVC